MSLVHTTRPTRRQILEAAGIGAAGVLLRSAPAEAQPSQQRRTFVLVHGAWHGGWCWRRVADRLQAAGHAVFTPTLTGLGERSHLMRHDITLDTHITDVVNVFKWENIENAVLCGHSYGGWPISGAIEQVLPQVASIVFLDAFVPRDGQTGLDVASATGREAIERALKEGAVSRPAPTAESFNVNPKDRAWVDAKMTPQPLGVSTQNIRLTGARERVPKKAYVRATNFQNPTFDAFFAEAKAKAGWRTFAVSSGHDVMVDEPDQLTKILLDAA